MKKATLKEIENSKDYPVGVYHCSTTNSTPFTECCDCACVEEENCPSCGLYVVGWDSHNPRSVRFRYAYNRVYR